MASIDFKLLSDFTGGLNFRADQFQLAANESPGCLNVEIDPRGGVFSRAGYEKINTTPIIASGSWNPKLLFNYKYSADPRIILSTGYDVDSVENGRIYHSGGADFTTLLSGVATPVDVTSANGAGITQWEDVIYIAPGTGSTYSYKWEVGDAYTTQLTASGPIWQKYEVPVNGYMPRAEHAIAHANKLFVANTYEENSDSPATPFGHPNRVRWSHESSPENWFQDDYIDIIAGGEGIRGLQIVDGQLLIFKPKAIYLLMGYDADSFQLVELTTVLGIDYPQQAVAGSGGVYFFDYPQGLYFYDRNGIQDIFARLRPMIINKQVNAQQQKKMTLSFVRNRVWLSMPYVGAALGVTAQDSTASYPTVNFVFDPTIGPQGAYTMFQTAPWYTDEALNYIAGFGLVSGCDWRSDNDQPHYLMVSPFEDYPHVMDVDNYDNVNDDVPVDTPVLTGFFASNYTTAWFDDNRYIQLKTFIRPYFVLKEVSATTILTMNKYRDYNETVPTGGTRTIIQTTSQTGGAYSIDGSGGVYGTATYGADVVGAEIKRKGIAALGKAHAVQLQIMGPDDTTDSVVGPGRKWGLNSIAFKFKKRKIRST